MVVHAFMPSCKSKANDMDANASLKVCPTGSPSGHSARAIRWARGVGKLAIIVTDRQCASRFLVGSLPQRKKRRRVRTTDSNHSNPVAPNLLNRQFSASAPNTKWVTDITAIETAEGDLYLAGVVDISSRMAVGWAMGNWRGRAIGHRCADDGCEQTTTTSRFAASLRSWQPIHESRISGSFEQLWCGSQHEQKSRLLR